MPSLHVSFQQIAVVHLQVHTQGIRTAATTQYTSSASLNCTFEWHLANYSCIGEHVLISIFHKDQGVDIFIKIARGDHKRGSQA